jgi:hypothetical protein
LLLALHSVKLLLNTLLCPIGEILRLFVRHHAHDPLVFSRLCRRSRYWIVLGKLGRRITLRQHLFVGLSSGFRCLRALPKGADAIVFAAGGPSRRLYIPFWSSAASLRPFIDRPGFLPFGITLPLPIFFGFAGFFATVILQKLRKLVV